jgi:hypothetical protein
MGIEQRILIKYGALTPSKILHYFIEDDFFLLSHKKRPWTFFVLGKVGPTGKTWLCRGLQEQGFTAFELTESIWPLISYRDEKNHVIKNDENRTITIIMNESLR